MGGLDSGRRYRKSEIKPLLEDKTSININGWNKENLLVPGNSFTNFYTKKSLNTDVFVEVEEEFLILQYGFQEQQILVKRIPAHYGGTRPYFICPLCGARRISLYLGTTGQFGCRICHQLGYKLQRMNALQRHTYMTEKYKDKLGQSSYPYKKPFRMWSKTFLKLQDKACAHEKKSCDIFLAYAHRMFDKYGSEVHKEKRI